MKNKKRLVITIVLIIALVSVIAATSYAVFTANLTGTKQNKLTTGYVTMNCNETTFNLENTNGLTDEQGIALENNEWTCTLNTVMNGKMNVGYDVALTNVTPSTGLTTSDVKIRALKVKNGTTTYVAGTENTGVLVSSIANSKGQYDTSITGYKIDSTTTNTNEEVTYKIKAWVAGESGTPTTTNKDGVCSDETYTTEDTCKAAGEIWGYEQKSSQAGGTFSFKVKVGASQVLS